jgi:hypothetical protein
MFFENDIINSFIKDSKGLKKIKMKYTNLFFKSLTLLNVQNN